jgi:Icc-related predicted phosphoesterase
MLTFTTAKNTIFRINPKKPPSEISPNSITELRQNFLNIREINRDDLQDKLDKNNHKNISSEQFLTIVCISDTHSKIPAPNDLPKGDILIHAGDLLACWKTSPDKPYRKEHFKKVVESLANLPYQHIILTPGNHDRMFDKNCEGYDEECLNIIKHHYPKIKYLVNEELNIKINLNCSDSNPARNQALYKNIKIYASPTVCYRDSAIYSAEYQKPFYDHAMKRGSLEMSENWKKIPDKTDILITHGPPLGVADLNKKGDHCGCADLLHEVVESRDTIMSDKMM